MVTKDISKLLDMEVLDTADYQLVIAGEEVLCTEISEISDEVGVLKIKEGGLSSAKVYTTGNIDIGEITVTVACRESIDIMEEWYQKNNANSSILYNKEQNKRNVVVKWLNGTMVATLVDAIIKKRVISASKGEDTNTPLTRTYTICSESLIVGT